MSLMWTVLCCSCNNGINRCNYMISFKIRFVKKSPPAASNQLPFFRKQCSSSREQQNVRKWWIKKRILLVGLKHLIKRLWNIHSNQLKSFSFLFFPKCGIIDLRCWWNCSKKISFIKDHLNWLCWKRTIFNYQIKSMTFSQIETKPEFCFFFPFLFSSFSCRIDSPFDDK